MAVDSNQSADLRALERMARSSSRRGRHQEAKELAEAALMLDPFRGETFELMASIARAAGEEEEAEAVEEVMSWFKQ